MEKRKLLLGIGAVIISSTAYAQVGINNTAPKSTLDISAKNTTGISNVPEGLLIPRVDRQRVQSMTTIPTSMMIYVDSVATGAATGPTVNIVDTGYYYFDGSVWLRFNDVGAAPLTKVAFNGSGVYTGEAVAANETRRISFPTTIIAVDPEIGVWDPATSEMTVNKKGVFTVTASLVYENMAFSYNASLIIRGGSENELIGNTIAIPGTIDPTAAGPLWQRNNISASFVLNPGDKIWVEARKSNDTWAVGKRSVNITFSEVN